MAFEIFLTYAESEILIKKKIKLDQYKHIFRVKRAIQRISQNFTN